MRKKFILFLSIIISIGIYYSIINIFYKPTMLNSLIATKLYSAPANKSFTDDAFYNCVIDSYNFYNSNTTKIEYTSSITQDEMNTIKKLICTTGAGRIYNIDGISMLKNLEEIEFLNGVGYIKNVDLSSNSNLTEIILKDSDIETIILPNTNTLKTLNLNSNNISDIDLSNNTSLSSLDLSSNSISNIDLSNNTSLSSLDLSSNSISNIGLSNNTSLSSLDLSSNLISNLDLSNNNKIGIVYLKNNELKNIAFPDVAHLSTLDLAHNYLEKLKLPVPYNQFGHLTLNLSDNLLKELDLSDYENYTIDTLYLSNNNFSNIDFSKFNIKEKIDIRNNKLVSLDLSSSDDIEMVIADNNYINQVNFTNNSNITYLSLNNNKLETINLENNINIKNLKLSNNKLETINLKNNINIKELELYNNSLASLILSNSNIQNLYISNNKLTNMTIPNLEYLEVIIANNNLLKELDLSSATSLKKLDLSNNNLNKININDSSNITDIILNNNLISDVKLPIANIKNLDLSNNNLTYIDLSTLSLIGNATINLNDNKFTSIDENWFKLNGITDDISDRIAIYIKNNPIIKNSTAIYKTDNISSVDISSEIKNMNIPNFYSYEYLVSIDTSFKDYLEKNNMNQSELDVKNANWVNPSYYKINNAIGGSYEIEYINEIKKQANDSLNKYKETQYTITFGFKQIVNILELSSEKYIIDDVNNIINIGKDKISTDILNNINLNIGKLNVSSNKVQLIYDDKIVKEYEIESNYEIMQPDDLTISNIIVDNVIDDSNKFYSTYNSNISFETSFKNNHSINDLNFIITNNEEDVSSKFNIDIKGNQIIISNKSIVEDGLYKINIYDNDKLLTAIELEVVNPIPVKDIVCNEINVAVNQSLKINYYVLPDDATNKKVKFEVSDTSIINVNDDGTLVGLKSGTTQLKLISAENNNIYKEITVNVFVADILSNNFNIDYNNKIIKEINDKLDFDLFKSMIETSNIIKMFDGEKEFISSSIFVGTGKEIRIYNNETLINTYKLSISGDVNGDGKILANDILIQKLHILNKSLLMDEYLMAGDINNDGKVNALDILYLKRYILGKTENVWDKK